MSKHVSSPVLGSYIWGGSCQLVTHCSSGSPFLLQVENFFFLVHKLDLQNANSKDADSNLLCFEQSAPKFSLIALSLFIDGGDLSVRGNVEDHESAPGP